jgi:hypothetical protein
MIVRDSGQLVVRKNHESLNEQESFALLNKSVILSDRIRHCTFRQT